MTSLYVIEDAMKQVEYHTLSVRVDKTVYVIETRGKCHTLYVADIVKIAPIFEIAVAALADII